MTALANNPTTAGDTPAVGEPHELGRYQLPDGTIRQLLAQRIDGHVRLVDVPLTGDGRRYLVERELEQDGYAALKALVVDYVTVAAERAEIPAASAPLERYLDHLAS
jgi:hypothetical protein